MRPRPVAAIRLEPNREKCHARSIQSDALKLVDQMKKLRNAPVVEEDYRGPVLFSNDAAADMFYRF